MSARRSVWALIGRVLWVLLKLVLTVLARLGSRWARRTLDNHRRQEHRAQRTLLRRRR